jgi:hypothetical protein
MSMADVPHEDFRCTESLEPPEAELAELSQQQLTVPPVCI